MEKTIELTAKENQQLNQMEQEAMRLNARWAMLRREMDELDKRLNEMAGEQRNIVRSALSERGIHFLTARLEQGRIAYTETDSVAVSKPNGSDPSDSPAS